MKLLKLLFGSRPKSIFTSVQEGNIDELKNYINNRGDLNIKHDGKCLLNFAIDNCEKNYTEIVELIINSGADVNSHESFLKETPLHRICARLSPNFRIIKLLLDKGVDANAVNISGKTPVFYCTFSYSVELLNLLVKYGADLNIRDKYNNTLLHDDYLNCNKEDFEEFLKAVVNLGVDINSRNSYGHTPLDMCKNPFIEKILIKHGAVKTE